MRTLPEKRSSAYRCDDYLGYALLRTTRKDGLLSVLKLTPTSNSLNVLPNQPS